MDSDWYMYIFAFFENFKPAGIATPARGPKSLQLPSHGGEKWRENNGHVECVLPGDHVLGVAGSKLDLVSMTEEELVMLKPWLMP